jgi:hypothetical protein
MRVILATAVVQISSNNFLCALAPHCEVHVFDMNIEPGLLSKWLTEEQLAKSKVEAHQMFIDTQDILTGNTPHRTVTSIMKELGHTHIDILKVGCL